MAFGKVKWYNVDKGFGFIVPDDGSEDVFLHSSALEYAGLSELEDGERLEFEIKEGRRREAVDIMQCY